MSGNVKIVYSISKNAARLVKAGKAVIESGGVRGLDGKLIELAKPAVNSVANNLSSPISLVSSLAGNVQSGFIQHGVNKANAKLDISLEKLDEIQNGINKLSQNNSLGWVNCAFSMVNCGVSMAGFYLTLSKLNQVSGQIHQLHNKIEQKTRNDYLESFDRYYLNINSDIGLLQDYDFSAIQDGHISDHLNEIKAFLSRIIREFENKEIDGMLGCNLIFNLSIAFSQIVKEYSAQYYYAKGYFPNNYDKWLQVLESIDSDSFKNYLKNFLIIDCIDIPMEQKYIAFSSSIYGIKYQLGLLEYTKQLVQQIEKNDYIKLDDFLQNKIQNNNCIEMDDYVCIPFS